MSHNIIIKDKQGTDVTYNEVSKINLLDTDGNEVVFSEQKPAQTKSITPTTNEQSVAADPGYELTEVQIGAIQTEEVTATENGDYEPTDGKFISKFTVAVPDNSTAAKPEIGLVITPTKEQQVFTPSGNTVYNEVTVEKIPDAYIIPTGTKSITENGTHAVTEFAAVEVNIPSEDLTDVLDAQGLALTDLETYVNSLPSGGASGGGSSGAALFDTTFANNTPEQIAKVSAIISYNNMTSAEVEAVFGWKLGDTISYQLSTGENVEMRIIGFNHDDKSDGSGKAGITLDMTHCLNTKYKMNSDNSAKTGWNVSTLRTVAVPEIKATLPTEWQNIIKKVNKKSATAGGMYTAELTTTEDELFVLSEIEVFGTATYAKLGSDEGTIYEYWKDKTATDRIKYHDSDNDNTKESAVGWWLRSCFKSNAFFLMVNLAGNDDWNGGGSSPYTTSFAFCV